MQKLNSVNVKKDQMVLNFVSDLAAQTVPVVIDLDNSIAKKIIDNLNVLRLILLHQEGFVPAEYLSLKGYESAYDFKDMTFDEALIAHYTDLECDLHITHFSMHDNETVCKIKAKKRTGSHERFTNVQYNAISLYETENEKLDKCFFAAEIVQRHLDMQEIAQGVFKSFAYNVYAESDSISTTADVEIEYILTENDLNIIN